MFVITPAGDNALEYALKSHSRIHYVDMNLYQNRLLESKLAINNLEYTYFWKLFGQGKREGFRCLLIDKLSPVLSSTGVQFWYKSRTAFDKCFYATGYFGLALVLFKWLVRAKGLGSSVHQSLDHGRPQHAGPSMGAGDQAHYLVRWVLSDPAFRRNALGVRINQMKLILDEGDAVAYINDALDSIMHRLLFKDD